MPDVNAKHSKHLKHPSIHAPHQSGAHEQGLSLPAPGETSLQARIRASSSALQLDRALVLVKEGRLQSLIQQHLEEERAPLPTSLPLSARSLAAFDQPFSHANLIAARKQHLQV